MIVGLLLAAFLVALGVGTALRQTRNLRALAARSHVPSDEYTYLRSQAIRRFRIAGFLLTLGVLIAGSFLSGMERRATEIGERGREDGPKLPNEDDKQFVQFYGAYWILIIVLVFGVVCQSIFDVWATRRYWLRVYRLMRDDHNALLQRDLALYRQQKMESREARIRRGLGDDEKSPQP